MSNRTLRTNKKQKTDATTQIVDCDRSALSQRITELLIEYRHRRQENATLCLSVLPKLRVSVLKLLHRAGAQFQVVDNFVYLEAPQTAIKGMVAPDIYRSLGGAPHASIDCLVRPDNKTEVAPAVAWWSVAPTLQQRVEPSLTPMPDLWIEVVSMSTSGEYRSAVAKIPAVRRGNALCHFVIVGLPCDITMVCAAAAVPVVIDYATMSPSCPPASLFVGYIPPDAPAAEESLRFHTIRRNMTLHLVGLGFNLDVSVVINACV